MTERDRYRATLESIARRRPVCSHLAAAVAEARNALAAGAPDKTCECIWTIRFANSAPAKCPREECPKCNGTGVPVLSGVSVVESAPDDMTPEDRAAMAAWTREPAAWVERAEPFPLPTHDVGEAGA